MKPKFESKAHELANAIRAIPGLDPDQYVALATWALDQANAAYDLFPSKSCPQEVFDAAEQLASDASHWVWPD